MVAIFCMNSGDAFCGLPLMPTCKNVNNVVSKDSPILQCNQPVIHFLTESGLKKAFLCLGVVPYYQFHWLSVFWGVL